MITLTKAQRKAVYRTYLHNPDGSTSYKEFRQRIRQGESWDGGIRYLITGYVEMYWGGMFVCMDPDGYTHSISIRNTFLTDN
jgi:hypothetical protein